jgi:hypothetical protein
MGRNKGTPKTGGRKAGSPNKTTASVKEWLQFLIDNNRKQIEKDFLELDPKDRILLFEKFLQYTTPRMQAVQSTIDINNLSEQQINMLANNILSNIENEDSAKKIG